MFKFAHHDIKSNSRSSINFEY